MYFVVVGYFVNIYNFADSFCTDQEITTFTGPGGLYCNLSLWGSACISYPGQGTGSLYWNSVMTTPTSRAMTNTRNDLYLSTEDRTSAAGLRAGFGKASLRLKSS